MNLTPAQLAQLQSLGISTPSEPIINTSNTNNKHQNTTTIHLSLGNSPKTPPLSNHNNRVLTPKLTIIPLLSISGLTLCSLGGLILLKAKDATTPPQSDNPPTSAPLPRHSLPGEGGTQVPKSIQRYLLTSQQFFSSAIQKQSAVKCTDRALPCPSPDQSLIVNLLNQSLLAATQAVKSFPQDYRGYQQRGRIYLSLIDSQPQLIDQAIADLSTAFTLNQSSSEISRDLATLYARKGDVNNTIGFLARTVAIEPTKAQNFYDLAKLQQQAGLIPDAVQTYTQLLTLVSDPAQKTQVETEKQSLESLLSQSNACTGDSCGRPSSSITPSPSTSTLAAPKLPGEGGTPKLDSPLIQASIASGLIIAAPQDSQNISVDNQTDSNSLSGTAILPSGQANITIKNDYLNSSSQVYLTITKGGKNQTLKLLSKSDKSFLAGFDSPLSEAVEFKWWIIN